MKTPVTEAWQDIFKRSPVQPTAPTQSAWQQAGSPRDRQGLISFLTNMGVPQAAISVLTGQPGTDPRQLTRQQYQTMQSSQRRLSTISNPKRKAELQAKLQADIKKKQSKKSQPTSLGQKATTVTKPSDIYSIGGQKLDPTNPEHAKLIARAQSATSAVKQPARTVSSVAAQPAAVQPVAQPSMSDLIRQRRAQGLTEELIWTKTFDPSYTLLEKIRRES
jgi:hypothetical protein